MKVRSKRTAALAWLPVLCLVALSFSTAPVASEPRQAGSLAVSPKHFYGGQGVTFRGTLGSRGRQTIWLEFHMGRPGDSWTRIEGSTRKTAADGSFRFVFPARGMNNIKLRVAARRTATPPVNFTAHDQAAALAVQPADLSYRDRTCGGDRLEHIRYDAVAGEGFALTVDAAPRGEPVLAGRKVFLERRDGSRWEPVATGTLDKRGRATFDLAATGTAPVAYRTRLGVWKRNGSRIGWYPSFPTYVDPLRRPDPLAGLDARDPTADPAWADPEELTVEWPAVADPAVDDIVIAWNRGPTAPGRPDGADDMVVRGAGVTQLSLGGLDPDTNYSFAVFARSGQGICSHARTDAERTDEIPKPLPVPGFTATATAPRQVQLTWDAISTAPPAGQQLTDLYVYRDGSFVARLDPTAPGYVDTGVWPESSYTYTIHTVNHWGEESPPVSASATTPPEVAP